MTQFGPDLTKVRYWIEFDEHGERLVMPLRRGWKAVALSWVGFSIVAFKFRDALSLDPGPFALAVDLLLAGLLLHLLLNLVTSLFAREVVQIANGSLVHGWRLLWLRREKRYPLLQISALSAERAIAPPKENELLSPLKDFGKVGAVNFDCNGTTVGLGAALDQAHGEQVVNWIARRAPRGVLAI